MWQFAFPKMSHIIWMALLTRLNYFNQRHAVKGSMVKMCSISISFFFLFEKIRTSKTFFWPCLKKDQNLIL